MTNLDKMSAASQSIIDRHLDAIEGSLRASGMTRSERSSILEDVENQIREMLAERTPDAPQENEVRAVIAELDAPESYRSPQDSEATAPAPSRATTMPPPHPPHLAKSAVLASLWPIPLFVGILGYLATGPSMEFVPAKMLGVFMGGITQTSRWLLLAMTAPFLTTLLGVIAISQIRHSQGRLYGRGLAVGTALLFPLLTALPLCLGLVVITFRFLQKPYEIFDPSYDHHFALGASMPIFWFMAFLLWVLLVCVVTRWTWRYSGKPIPSDIRESVGSRRP